MFDTYKALLAESLKATEGRTVYNNTEVRDILLDLWLALDHDEETLDLELQPA